MVLPGHLAGGYIAAEALLSLLDPALSPGQIAAVYAIGTLAGELPDIDIAIHALVSRLRLGGVKLNHRQYVTHAPIFWLGVSAIIAAAGLSFSSIFIIMCGLAVLAGTLSHFILDSIDFGIRWLWPFSQKRISLTDPGPEVRTGDPSSFSYYRDFILKEYYKKISFYAEIAVTVIALYLFLGNY